MKLKHIMLTILALCLLLSACGQQAVEETQLPTQAPTEPTVAATEPVQEEAVIPAAVLPEEDAVTGTLIFYLNDTPVHAGGPVSDLVDAGIHTYADLTEILQPGHMSGAIRVLVDIPDMEEDEEPFIFFAAMNPYDEPKMISECLIYSLTANYADGVLFGSGKEEEPFVTGTTTLEELLEAYGEPTETVTRKERYKELFYYEPFSCVSFLCKNGVVRQVNAYYGANVFSGLAEDLDFELTGRAQEDDAVIFMSQYMDVTPYLTGEERSEEDKTGILESFDESFWLNGSEIKFGIHVSELPSPFMENLVDLEMPLSRNYYTRTGRGEPEEFFLINSDGQRNSRSNNLVVKGVIVENPSYCNWGFDNSLFHEFSCQGVTQDSTIAQVLELLGQPRELLFTSVERNCFVWMHYETEAGDYLHIRVDPILDQVVEVNMVKHFEKERSY